MLRWTLHQSAGRQANHASVVVKHQVYCFGGVSDRTSRYQMNVHVFNTVSLCWTDLPPVKTGRKRPPEVPSLSRGYTAVLVEDVIYIWGGYRGCREHCRNRLYAFDVDTHGWLKREVSGAVPAGRQGHSACVLGKVMYVLGGYNKAGHAHDMYKLDTSTMVWSLITTGGTPPPAYSSYQSATIIGAKMFVLLTLGQARVREFDTETNCWLGTLEPPVQPPANAFHIALAYNGELYILGDCDPTINYQFNCLWNLHSDKKFKTKGKGVLPPVGRCCVVEDRIILFGKYNACLNALYILDLSPRLKTLCKEAVIQYGLEQSQLPHNSRWELAAMTANNKRKREN